ncbi:DUF669 domain-containing protein [Levilactobacillus hammesii]|uniref:Single stranded binding protein n=1 Tax=Levilactobacillus hammesii DSM 16381 TaxID=1423753 RepID=A0A0R1UQW5_9LACO|nr:DUF669 domain-containing protein [Levilactobacillus hammesii]KRL95548.1 hypothetical protein FD28_GL002518 [Levilactobacillus hammesii DSM 16381]
MADFMNTDYSNNTGGNYDAVPAGNYEMIINNASESATKNGAETLQIDLLVRNDLDKVTDLVETNGKFHNRHIFVDNWKRKATNQYDLDGFQYILQAAGVPENTPLHTVDDFIKLIVGAPVRVFVKQEENTYNGATSTVNRVAPWNFEVTQFPQVQHTFKDKKNAPTPAVAQPAPAANTSDPFANTGDSIDISADDLPF